MASEFTESSVKEFLIANGGRVKNTDLVTHFKRFLNDPDKKDEMREKFKNYVNTLATIKMDDNKEKILMLKKRYREDSSGGKLDNRAQSEPPNGPANSEDRPDGAAPSRVKSDGNLSAADLRMSSSTLSNDTESLGSGQSSSSTRSLSSVGQEEDTNASILSVKERAKHLNRIESESEIQKVSATNLGAVRKKEHRKVRDPEGDDTGSDSYSPLSALEKDWLVKCSAAEYHLMNELLSKNPRLATVKEFTSGYTALHWAAKKGKPEVIKMLLSKPGVYVNQRTNGGYTPLHLAAIQGHEAIIELLTKTFNADSNIRDFSGKKAKQYLSNSASSRAQRKSKSLTSSINDTTDSPITTSINLRSSGDAKSIILRNKPSLAISPPSDFRKVKSELISSPTDFRHVQSANFSNQIGGFGSGSLRASVRVEPVSPPESTSVTLKDNNRNSSYL